MSEKHWLTAEDESETARAIEAGIIAAAALAEGWEVGASIDELACLARLGEAGTAHLLTAHGGLVRFVVAQEYRGFGSRDDLYQEGWLALAEAARRFDHRRGRFATYAMTAVRGAVRIAIAREQGLSERQARGLRRIRGTESTLTQSLGRVATDAEVAAALQRGTSWVTWCARRGEATRPELLDELPDRSAEIQLPGEQPGTAALRRAVGTLPEPERIVVCARYPADGKPRSFDDLAAELGVSQSTARRLERRGLDALRRRLSRWEEVAA